MSLDEEEPDAAALLAGEVPASTTLVQNKQAPPLPPKQSVAPAVIHAHRPLPPSIPARTSISSSPDLADNLVPSQQTPTSSVPEPPPFPPLSPSTPARARSPSIPPPPSAPPPAKSSKKKAKKVSIAESAQSISNGQLTSTDGDVSRKSLSATAASAIAAFKNKSTSVDAIAKPPPPTAPPPRKRRGTRQESVGDAIDDPLPQESSKTTSRPESKKFSFQKILANQKAPKEGVFRETVF
jgi:hypothetical protein